MARGQLARNRRRQRRSHQQQQSEIAGRLEARKLGRIEALAAAPEEFAASGSTSLPLGPRDAKWDGPAAAKAVKAWAGADDAPNAKYASAFFLKRDDGKNFGDYGLGFAEPVDGKLTANWGGITAVAGVLSGARGGVKGVSDADIAAIKNKVETYYSKAAKAYDDDKIKAPWADGNASAEDVAMSLAYAQIGPADEAVLAVAAAGILEQFAAMADCDNCGDSYADHLGTSGPCTADDCDCTSYEEPDDEEPEEGSSVKAISAAAGDTTWGPEDGFQDLLSDVRAQLGGDDWWAADATLDLTKVLVCNWDDDKYWVAPIEMRDGEPYVGARADWVEVEQAWVESNDEYVRSLQKPTGAKQATLSLRIADGAFDNLEQRVAFAINSGIEGALTDWRETIGTHLTFDVADTLPEQHQPGSVVPPMRPSPAAPVLGADADPMAWSAIFAPEGRLTSDGRAFAPGAITWRNLPLTLMAMTETSEGGHVGAEVAGRIDEIWRDEAGLIRAKGVFDDGDYGQEIARLVADQTLRGVSVDLAIARYETGPRSDWFDQDGNWAPAEKPVAEEAPSLVDLYDQDVIAVVLDAEIGMTTVCPFPAFAEARIEMGNSLIAGASAAFWTATGDGQWETPGCGCEDATEALTASGGDPETLRVVAMSEFEVSDGALTASSTPVAPPADWFTDPGFEELTAVTVTEDGRVFGHAAPWGVCHIGLPGCRTAPHSQTGYRYFHLGEIECEDGSRVACGQITLDTGHATHSQDPRQATAHYDHTGTVVAHVVAGEDEYGVWVAGALQPDTPEEKIRLLAGSKLSGDWRKIDGGLELVALLAVNVPGFPVPRALAASGEPLDEPTLARFEAIGRIDEFQALAG